MSSNKAKTAKVLAFAICISAPVPVLAGAYGESAVRDGAVANRQRMATVPCPALGRDIPESLAGEMDCGEARPAVAGERVRNGGGFFSRFPNEHRPDPTDNDDDDDRGLTRKDPPPSQDDPASGDDPTDGGDDPTDGGDDPTDGGDGPTDGGDGPTDGGDDPTDGGDGPTDGGDDPTDGGDGPTDGGDGPTDGGDDPTDGGDGPTDGGDDPTDGGDGPTDGGDDPTDGGDGPTDGGDDPNDDSGFTSKSDRFDELGVDVGDVKNQSQDFQDSFDDYLDENGFRGDWSDFNPPE